MCAHAGAEPVMLDPLRDARVDLTTKGFPTVDRAIPLADVAERGWTLEDLLPPVLVLRERALAHNIALMADYCETHGVELAPHGKTTMAPQLWRRQLDAGAWGITAATVGQARVMLAAGVRRVLIANEVTDPPAIAWIAAQLRDTDAEILCSVDSSDGVELLADGHARCSPAPSGPRRARPSRRARRIPQPRRGARGRPAREDEASARPGRRDRLRGDDRSRPNAARASTRYERSSMGSPR